MFTASLNYHSFLIALDCNLNSGHIVVRFFQVTMARRQPVIDPINDSTSSTTWATIAASHSQKGGHKDKRNLVAYDEDVF